MSDEMKKLADTPQGAAANPPMSGSADGPAPMPDDVMASVDGEIDLARLAPQLRGLYQELLNEPIPDRFTKLLDDLSRKENDSK